MIDGNELWNSDIVNDMIEKSVSLKRTVQTFPNLADNLYAALKRTTLLYPDKTAIVDNFRRAYTYSELLRLSEELAAFLYFDKGIKKNSHVGLMMYNCVEFCVAFLALARIGAVTVPLPSKFRAAEVLPLARRAEVGWVICDEEYADWFQIDYERVLPVCNIQKEYGFNAAYRNWKNREIDLENLKAVPTGDAYSPSLIMFTSGTTSKSKGVLLRNYNIAHAIEAYRRTLSITAADISVIATPIYHITGLVALLGLFLSTGGKLYLHKYFDAKRVIKEAREEKFTFIHASPSVFNLLLEAGKDTPAIPSLVSFACGSSNMMTEKLLQLHNWLPGSAFHTVYGLTETSSPATIFPEDAAASRHIGSSGIPVPGTKFKIVNEAGEELLPGEAGEIVVSGTTVLESYYRQEAQELEQGWLYTGDIGYFDKDSYLYIVDRKKNMINRGGEKIGCYDVENEMIRIEGVEDAAVVGIPNDLYGEVAAAVVRLAPNCLITEEKMKEQLKERLAKYKVPEKIKVVTEIPHTPNGKPDKKKIKQILTEV